MLKYDYDPRQSPIFPVNWDEIFNRRTSLAVEVGCGNGEFLVEWAKARPDWDFVGIELSLASGERLLSRVDQNQLQNVRLIRDDARFILRELFTNESVAGNFTTFPYESVFLDLHKSPDLAVISNPAAIEVDKTT